METHALVCNLMVMFMVVMMFIVVVMMIVMVVMIVMVIGCDCAPGKDGLYSSV